MSVRDSVFGSNLEKKKHAHLMRVWGDHYEVYHNLPALNVFNGRGDLFDESLSAFRLTDDEYDKLKKLSIDFVLCTNVGKPLVGIEFDGLQDGWNQGRDYESGTEGRDCPARRDSMELKLKVAHGSDFPLFVLGTSAFKGLSDRTMHTIADGIIGEVLSLKSWRSRISSEWHPEKVGLTEEEFEGLSPFEQEEMINNWSIEIEVEEDYRNSPISRQVMKYAAKVGGHSISQYFPPTELRRPGFISVKCGIRLAGGDEYVEEVELPEYKTPGLPYPIHLAIQIATLLAYEAALREGKKEKGK